MEITKQYQSILSFGYIYLVILGILNQTFYYNQLGIDILLYSSITDILISPIAQLTSSFLSISIFLLMLMIVFSLPSWLVKFKDQKWFKTFFRISQDKSTAEIRNNLMQANLIYLALGLLGFYVGTGLGGGFKFSKKIENQEITYEDTITFINGNQETIHIVGKNSAFLFYLVENQQEILIAPMNGGGIKNILEKQD